MSNIPPVNRSSNKPPEHVKSVVAQMANSIKQAFISLAKAFNHLFSFLVSGIRSCFFKAAVIHPIMDATPTENAAQKEFEKTVEELIATAQEAWKEPQLKQPTICSKTPEYFRDSFLQYPGCDDVYGWAYPTAETDVDIPRTAFKITNKLGFSRSLPQPISELDKKNHAREVDGNLAFYLGEDSRYFLRGWLSQAGIADFTVPIQQDALLNKNLRLADMPIKSPIEIKFSSDSLSVIHKRYFACNSQDIDAEVTPIPICITGELTFKYDKAKKTILFSNGEPLESGVMPESNDNIGTIDPTVQMKVTIERFKDTVEKTQDVANEAF